MTLEILFIGLREQGASLAMALNEAPADAIRLGYDPDKDAARAAEETGALEKVVSSPRRAARSADLVVINLSSTEAQEILKDIGPELKQGSAVLDCSPMSSSTFRWALENLAPERHYIGAMPVVRHDSLHVLDSAHENARSDLYQGSQLALVIPAETPEPVVNIVLNFARTIGCRPFFLDPAEMDAVTSLIDTVPTVLGVALLLLASDSGGWPDIQRVAGRAFAAVTHSTAEKQAERLSRKLIDNQESLIVHLEAILDQLHELRDLLAEGDRQELEARLEQAIRARKEWLTRRKHDEWEAREPSASDLSGLGLFGNLFGEPDPGGDDS